MQVGGVGVLLFSCKGDIEGMLDEWVFPGVG